MRFASVVMLLLMLSISACAPIDIASDCAPSAKPTEEFEIDVEVEGDKYAGYRLNILTDSKCTSDAPKQKGCIVVPEDKRARIVFTLNDGKGPNCEGASDQDWHWYGVEMSKQSTKRGARQNPDAPSTGQMRDDFCTDTSGKVANETFSLNTMAIENENSEAYDIWYTLIAESCGEKRTKIYTDPRIRNRGTN